MPKNEMGAWGEEQAAKYLAGQGYTVLERNFRSRFGEIDIIAKKDNTICFIEVKTRKKSSYIMPMEAVNYSKQRKIIASANAYLMRYYSEKNAFRFDVIEVFYYNRRIFSVNHLKGAFEL